MNVPALIPDDYLPDVHARLTLYKRISSARNVDELRELQVEMIDRFGLLPDQVKHLFATAELKLQADALGIRKLDLGAEGGRLQFVEKPDVRSEEHTSELHSLMRISYAVFCLKKKTNNRTKKQ